MKIQKKKYSYFVREINGIGVADVFEEAKGLESKTRDNGLFISLVDQFNSNVAKIVMWELAKMEILSGINHQDGIFMTDVLYKKDEFKNTLKRVC